MRSRSTIVPIALGVMMFASSSARAQLAVELSVKDGRPQCEINRRVTTSAEVDTLLKTLHGMVPGARVTVSTSADTPASDLVAMLFRIRECKITNVVVSTPATWNGQQGTITLSADISPRPVSDTQYAGGFEALRPSDLTGMHTDTTNDIQITLPDDHKTKTREQPH